MSGDEEFPKEMTIELVKVEDLPYGSNPGDPAALYKIKGESGGIPDWELLFGDPLSFNNYRDGGMANRLLDGFGDKHTVVMAKHGIYAGIAWAPSLEEARKWARACDPEANFGGVEVYTREVSIKIAEEIKKDADNRDIRDIIAAPSFEEGTIDILSKCRKGKYKKKMRVAKTVPYSTFKYDIKYVDGGFLLEKLPDYSKKITKEQLRVVSEREPTEAEMHKMMAAEDVVWRVPSNAVVVGDGRIGEDGSLEAFWTYGIGTSTKRNRAGKMAADNANDLPMLERYELETTERAKNAAAASDGFFPKPDTLDILAEAGVTAVLSSAGALREEDVIKAANDWGIAFVLSSRRIFSH